MKKFCVIFCIFLAGYFILESGQASTSSLQAYEIYFVDRQMHRLLPTDFKTSEKSQKKISREIINSIILGKDFNNQILRIIPDIPKCIRVKVKKGTAFVDLSSEITNHVPKNAETERLIVYQIVNSLTSIPDINFVKFTIDGKTKKDFLGFLDMREIFKANYSI